MSHMSAPVVVVAGSDAPALEDALPPPESLFVTATLRIAPRPEARAATVRPSDGVTAPRACWRCPRRGQPSREARISRKMEEMFVETQRGSLHSTRVRGMTAIAVGLFIIACVKVGRLNCNQSINVPSFFM